MKIAYVIARYRAPTVFEVRQHVHEAELLAAELDFLERCLRLVEVSDLGVAHRNYEASWGGCRREIQAFNSALKPIYYWPSDIALLREHVNLPHIYEDEYSDAPDD